jgi:hypothetical protein
MDDWCEEREKTAATTGWLARQGKGAGELLAGNEVGKGLMSGALFAGGMGIASAVGKTVRAITKKRDFDGMLEANPDLQDYRKSNPTQFNRHYSSFRSLNPRFAGDPVVAGSYMRQMSEYPATAGKTIVESLKDAPKDETRLTLPMPGGMGGVGITRG